MFKINDTVIYSSSGICKIEDIIQRTFKDELKEYYVLRQIKKPYGTIYVPTDNQVLVNKIKKLLTKEEIHLLLNEIEDKQIEWPYHDNVRKDKFRNIIKQGDRKEIMQLIATIYLKELEMKNKGKRIHAIDKQIFTEAQSIIHEEIAYVLDIKSEDVVNYISQYLKDKSVVS